MVPAGWQTKKRHLRPSSKKKSKGPPQSPSENWSARIFNRPVVREIRVRAVFLDPTHAFRVAAKRIQIGFFGRVHKAAQRRRVELPEVDLRDVVIQRQTRSPCNYRSSPRRFSGALCPLSADGAQRSAQNADVLFLFIYGITVTVYMTPSQQSGLPGDGRLHSGFWPGLAAPMSITVTVYLNSHGNGGSRLVFPSTRGFGPGLPGARRRPSRRSKRRDPFRRPKRSSDGGCPLNPSRRRGVGRCCEKRSKIGPLR
jgi:hypothetical protein